MDTSPETPRYAELLCTSNFSFLKSASHPEELVEQAHRLGYTALALTDECSLAGIVRAHGMARKLQFKLIVGAQFVFSCDSEFAGERLVLLVKNMQGYQHLCRLITQARRRSHKGDYRFIKDDLADCPPGLLVLLCPNPIRGLTQLSPLLKWASARFHGRLGLAFTFRMQGFDAAWLLHLQALASVQQVPILATQDARMHSPGLKPVLDVLQAIGLGHTLHEARHSLEPNAERSLHPLHTLQQRYPKALLDNTVNWAESCTFSMNELRYQYPREITPEHLSVGEYLSELTWQGAVQRYGEVPEDIQKQIQHELDLIATLAYEPYFLTVYDIVQFARSRQILCQGRGSAANSMVCYCLGITEVSPSLTAMLFERFISRERNEPPDIDVDFEHTRREEVIQYIYTKYGRDRAALAASVVVYRPRSALRDVGKALGLNTGLVDTLAKSQDGGYSRALNPEHMRMAGVNCDDPAIKRCLHIAESLLGFPRHLSQHTGGFVIARDSLCELVPVENAAMPERSVIQWDKDDLDTMGLLKVDVLALGMLSAIRMSLDCLGAKPMSPRSMADIPKEDPQTYAMISRADTIGVFQIESRAQMSMLPRLKPKSYYDLVIQVAIVRPGPIQGGMVHPYLRRRANPELVSYPSPALKTALERTLGVPIFQEQVMQIAIHAAGFSPGEADELRRGMAAWKKKGGLHHFHERFMNGMREGGYSTEFAEGIFKQMEGFGEYGFPESHAASFALLVYVSSWLKCHHPDAYLCGLLNAQPMGFYQASQLIRDAQAHGVKVLPVDVQHSQVLSVLEADGEAQHMSPALLAVRLGLKCITALSTGAAQRINEARQQGPFKTLEDLKHRAGLNRNDFLALSDANALQSLSGHRRQAAWATAGLSYTIDLLQNSASQEEAAHTGALTEPSDIENMLADYRSVKASLTHHPLQFLRAQLAPFKIQTISTLRQYPDGRLARACGLVTHRQRPATAKGTVFLTLEDETGQVNVIVWNDLAEQFRTVLRGAQLMGVFGVWQQREGVYNLLAKRLVDYTSLLRDIEPQADTGTHTETGSSHELRIRSRDFR